MANWPKSRGSYKLFVLTNCTELAVSAPKVHWRVSFGTTQPILNKNDQFHYIQLFALLFSYNPVLLVT